MVIETVRVYCGSGEEPILCSSGRRTQAGGEDRNRRQVQDQARSGADEDPTRHGFYKCRALDLIHGKMTADLLDSMPLCSHPIVLLRPTCLGCAAQSTGPRASDVPILLRDRQGDWLQDLAQVHVLRRSELPTCTLRVAVLHCSKVCRSELNLDGNDREFSVAQICCKYSPRHARTLWRDSRAFGIRQSLGICNVICLAAPPS